MDKKRYAFIDDCINDAISIDDLDPPLSLGEKKWYEKRKLEIEAMRKEIPDAVYDPWMHADIDFDDYIELFDPDEEYPNDAHPFKYKTIEEYIDDIIVWICENYHNSKETAKQKVKWQYKWVEEGFAKHTPVELCAIEIGYSCG